VFQYNAYAEYETIFSKNRLTQSRWTLGKHDTLPVADQGMRVWLQKVLAQSRWTLGKHDTLPVADQGMRVWLQKVLARMVTG